MSVTASTEDVRTLLAEHCFMQGLAERYVDQVVRSAVRRDYPEGALLFHEGGTADEFHLLVEGRVAIEMYAPGRGALVVDTVEPCETVGWSWLVPPYRWFFSARALSSITTVSVDATVLRAVADQDPGFGYALMTRVSGVMLERMQAARVRLADLYGDAGP
jgi:CRP/FNR family cyclic AMP-dependent transcriptional regulator